MTAPSFRECLMQDLTTLKKLSNLFPPIPQLIPTLHPIKKDKVFTIASHQVATKEGFAQSETFLEKTAQTAFATGIFHFNHLVLYVPPTR